MTRRSFIEHYFPKIRNSLYHPKGIFLMWLSGVLFFYSDSIKYLSLHVFTLPSITMNFLKLTFLALKIILLISFFVGCRYMYYYIQKNFRSKKLFYSVLFSSVSLFLINNLLLLLERIRYQNYIYSKVGLSPEKLHIINVFLTLSFFTCILYFFRQNTILRKKSKMLSPKVFLTSYNMFITIFFFSSAFMSFLFSFYPFTSFREVLLTSRMTHDVKFGVQYKYVEALRQITPQDAVIVHPEQGVVWPLIGNQPVIRYFLFPRILVSAGVENFSSAIQDFSIIFLPKITDAGAEWPLIENQKIRINESTEFSYKKLEELRSSNSVSIYKVFLYE